MLQVSLRKFLAETGQSGLGPKPVVREWSIQKELNFELCFIAFNLFGMMANLLAAL